MSDEHVVETEQRVVPAAQAEQDQQTAYARFVRRQRHDQEVMEKAIAQLASVLDARPGEVPVDGTPLYRAAFAVGAALGIAVKPPARWEDLGRLKDPIEAIARASRFRTRRVLLRGDWWNRDNGPLLAWSADGERPLALLPRTAGGYDCFDPAADERYSVTAEVVSGFGAHATMFYRPLPDTAVKAFDLLRLGMLASRRDMPVVILMAGIVALLGLVTPQATAFLIDHVIPDAQRSLITQVGLALGALALTQALFQLVQNVALLRAETLAESATEAAVWDRLLKLKLTFFRQYAAGELASRMSAIDQIRQLLTGSTVQALLAGVFSLASLVQLFGFNQKMALVALGVAVVSVAVTTLSGALVLRATRAIMQEGGKILGLVVGLIGGVAKIRTAGAESRAFAQWAKTYSGLTGLNFRAQRLQDRLSLFDELLPIASTLILFNGFGLMAKAAAADPGQGAVTAGTFIAFNAAFGSFVAGLTGIGSSVTSLMQVVSLWERAKPILEALPEVGPDKVDPGRLSGRIAFEHVSFRYTPEAPHVLRDVSLALNPGEFVALVGPSGSGKSSLFRLLLGFEEYESGKIALDGQDLRGLDLPAVRRQMGVVLQHGRLMAASIFENIANGALITQDEAWEAARNAGFADDVTAMPMGMHTVVSEGGGNLSGGQRQRLLIARALALKPRILLFDEATSALDSRTQAIVSESLERMNVTRLVIAHRLSTIRQADRIYVLEGGQVVQEGTFEALMAEEGMFSRLMTRQTT
ncbi:NHLP bacteriocin export ABC transporter permease/ATPase subunit [bacterium]|nr:NHLP bacteriocin export ABC transporter permease/ATPase subunit [bacterium]